jgi:hypothetical protein
MQISIRRWVLRLVVLLARQRTGAAAGSSASRAKGVDDHAIATLEVPLANPAGAPKQHVSSDFYYRIRCGLFTKRIPSAPGREPEGYMDSLKQREPEIVWDDAAHKPSRRTESDWIAAGEATLVAPIYYTNHR